MDLLLTSTGSDIPYPLDTLRYPFGGALLIPTWTLLLVLGYYLGQMSPSFIQGPISLIDLAFMGTSSLACFDTPHQLPSY